MEFGNEPRLYQGKESWPGFSIKGRIPMRSPSLRKNFGKQYSSTRLACSIIINTSWVKLMLYGQLSQQQSMDDQVSQLAVSLLPLSSPPMLRANRSNAVFAQFVFGTSRGGANMQTPETYPDVFTERTRSREEDTAYPCVVKEAESGR